MGFFANLTPEFVHKLGTGKCFDRIGKQLAENVEFLTSGPAAFVIDRNTISHTGKNNSLLHLYSHFSAYAYVQYYWNI